MRFWERGGKTEKQIRKSNQFRGSNMLYFNGHFESVYGLNNCSATKRNQIVYIRPFIVIIFTHHR